MRSISRIAAALMVAAVIAAGCGDDGGVDQATVDSVVDDLIDESTAQPDNSDAEDPSEVVEDPPVETEDPPVVDDVPPAPMPVDNCVILRHYQAEGLFEAPYYTTVTTLIDLTGDEEVTVVMPDDNEFSLSVWPTDDVDGVGQIDIDFPVAGPGDVILPQIFVDGEPIHPELQANFWDGNTSFVAAGADIRDEEIYPTPACNMGYMVQVDPSTLGFG